MSTSAAWTRSPGSPYTASDSALLLWVHATFVSSGIVAAALFGTPLAAPDSDRFVAEMVTEAELVGVPRDLVPASTAELEAYIAKVRPELRCTPAARESMDYLLDPPGLDEDMAEIWQDVRDAAVAALPGWAREMYGYAPPPLTDARRTEITRRSGCSTPCSSVSRGCSKPASGLPCACVRPGRRED